MKSKTSDESVRYTDDGINVVALDRRGRGLHRARPEPSLSSKRSSPLPRSRATVSMVVMVLALAAVLAAIWWVQ